MFESVRQPHLKDYLGVISARRWVLIGVFVLIVLSVTVFVFVQTPIYQAETLLLIEPSKVNLTEFKGVSDPTLQAGGELSRREFYETQYHLLVSRGQLEKTFQKFDFGSFEEFRKRRDPIPKFGTLFKVLPVRRSRLVTVTFNWKDPELAARVLDFMVNEFIKDYRSRSLGVTTSGVGALRKKAEELRPKVEAEANRLQKFVADTDMLSLEKTENIIIDRLKEISKNLSDVERKRIEFESIYDNIQAMKENQLIEDMPEIAGSATIRDLKLEYIRTKQDVNEMSKRLGPNHPEVVTARTRLKTIGDKLEQEMKSALVVIESQLDRTRKQEDELRKELNEQEQRVMTLNKKSTYYTIMQDSYETYKKTYNAIVKRIEEIDITLAAGSKDDNVFIITPARVPVEPIKPRKALSIVLACCMGLSLGIGLCFLLEYFDTTIKTKDDVENILGLPVLGYTPLLRKQDGAKISANTRRPIELQALDEERSAVAEAFRSIRTALFFSKANGEFKNILVTSALPFEGKTITSINIAIALAKSGKKVLLVDADLRKPRLHKVFQMDYKPGLSNVLADQGVPHVRELFRPVQGVKNLRFLPSGPMPPNPAELLGSPRMKAWIDKLNEYFDVVLFDTPPVINVTDSVVLSQYVREAIVVVRSFATQKEAARQAKELLLQAKGKILGVVLNSVDVPRSGYYSYDGYRYFQKYQYYGEEDLHGKRKRRSSKSKNYVKI